MAVYVAKVSCKAYDVVPMEDPRYNTRLVHNADESIYICLYAVMTRRLGVDEYGSSYTAVYIQETQMDASKTLGIGYTRSYYMLRHVCTIKSDLITTADLNLDAICEACSFAVYTELDLILKAFDVKLIRYPVDMDEVYRQPRFENPLYPPRIGGSGNLPFSTYIRDITEAGINSPGFLAPWTQNVGDFTSMTDTSIVVCRQYIRNVVNPIISSGPSRFETVVIPNIPSVANPQISNPPFFIFPPQVASSSADPSVDDAPQVEIMLPEASLPDDATNEAGTAEQFDWLHVKFDDEDIWASIDD